MVLDIWALNLIPGLVIGIIAGIVDLFFMIKDESGSAKSVLGHGLGAFIPLIIFSVISMNITLVTSLEGIANTALANEPLMRIIFVLVMVGYIHAKSALFKGAKGAGMSETWIHSLIITILVGLAPYLWVLIGPMLPAWAGGSQ